MSGDFFTRSIDGNLADRPDAEDLNNGYIFYAVDVDETSRSNGQYWINITPRLLGPQTVGTVQVSVPHSLPYVPSMIIITMTSGGTIFKSAPSDATSIYLTGDAAALTAEVAVR